MLNMNWTVDANNRITATWKQSDTNEGMPLSLALMEAEAPQPTPSTARPDLIAEWLPALSRRLCLRASVR